MNTKKLVMTLFTAVIVASFANTASPSNSGSEKGSGVAPCFDFDAAALSQLNLTAKQMTEINVLRDDFLKDTRPLADKTLSKRSELKRLWLQEYPDQEKITIAQEEIRALKNHIRDMRNVYLLKVYNVLTQEQRERIGSCGPGRSYGHDMRSRARWHGNPVHQGGDPGRGVKDQW